MKKDDVLIKVDHVSKKFSKDLKKSLQYGLMDLTWALFGKKIDQSLRPAEFWAVRDVNFELKRGECLGLIGHNGAGKSTLLKMLNGLIKPDEGSIEIRGRVGALIELGAGFNPILTGRENIYNNGAVLGFSKKEIDAKLEAIIEFSEIEEFIDAPVQNYSSGMKVRLGFAVAAQMEPDVLIIDEVLAVGDAGFRFKCLNAIGDIMKNAAVIFVSHSMPQVYRICSEVMLMQKGQSLIHTKDIGKGVEQYFNMFEDGKKQIIGSGEAKLIEMELESKKNKVKSDIILPIRHGNELKIKMKISLDSHISEAKLQLVFWNQDLIPVMDVLNMNLDGFIIKNNSTKYNEVEVEIPNMYLNSGKHTISLIVNSVDMSKLFLRFDKAGVFNMTAEFASGAEYLMPLKWKNIESN